MAHHCDGAFIEAKIDRTEGFAVLEKFVSEWGTESDAREVFLRCAAMTVKYLKLDEIEESHNLIQSVCRLIDKSIAVDSLSEAFVFVARQVLEGFKARAMELTCPEDLQEDLSRLLSSI